MYDTYLTPGIESEVEKSRDEIPVVINHPCSRTAGRPNTLYPYPQGILGIKSIIAGWDKSSR